MIGWLKRIFCKHFWVREEHIAAFAMKDVSKSRPPYVAPIGSRWWWCCYCGKWILRSVLWLPVKRLTR